MKTFLVSTFFFLVLLFTPFSHQAQTKLPVNSEKKAEQTWDMDKTIGTSQPLQIIILLTLLSFIPAILISMTCFTRLIVVFHFLRQALGTQETPNNQILIGLSLFITLFVMSPTFT